MTTTNKAVMALSLAIKAGKLVAGYDAVERAVLSKRAKTIVMANDISTRTERNITRVSKDLETIKVPFGADELLAVFGRRVAVVALTDSHFSDLLAKALQS